MVSTSSAGEVAQCPVGSVPIQVVGEGGSSSVTTLPAATQSDFGIIGGGYPDFNAFVAAVTEHVAARLGKNKLCIDNAESRERSLLQFMHWKIRSGNNPPAPVTSLDARPSNGCRISSPWIDLAIERKPIPWIRAIVRWNERQFLADQAVLAGMLNVPPSVAKPLTNAEYGHFVSEYKKRELCQPTVKPLLDGENISSIKVYSTHSLFFCGPTEEPIAEPIEEYVPSDLLWLFRRFFSSGRGGYSAYIPKEIKEKNAEDYTKIVLALIDRCFASNDEANLQYDNILDIADLISLEQYKIDTPPIR